MPLLHTSGISRRGVMRLGLRGAALWAAPAFAASCPPDPGPAGVAAVETAIGAAMKACSVASISYAVISCGKVYGANAHGSASPTTAATSATLYQAASISKTLAAIAGLYAVQANTKGLTLDSDISGFETSWTMPAGAQTPANPVTLRGLLGMTAGANIHGYAGYPLICVGPSACAVPTLVQILNGGAPTNNPAARIVTTPGAQWAYSGGGYEIAESLIGDVMGSAYGDLVQANVLAPLKMANSTWGVPLPASLANSAAYAYVKPGQPASTQWDAYPQLAAAGLWTTPTDLATLLLEIPNALAGGGAVLTAASAQAMLTQVGTSQYGLGGAIRNPGGQNVLFMKSGGNLGFTNWLAFYPELGEGLVVFTNYDGGAEAGWPAKVFPRIFFGAAKAMGWPDFKGLQDSG